MAVEQGSKVKLAFTATYPDGELYDTSSREVAAEHGVEGDKRFRPIVVEVGSSPTIQSLQEGLLGMEVGDTREITVPHEEFRLTWDRTEFETMVDEPATEGMEVHAKTGLIGRVVSLDDESVTVDFDPDRAGESLTFDVEVLEVE
ncbi:FKBP-type peptidyl-prolyl cis-trans isomerase [Haloarchaeobius sp. HRN-SO-5]|uniref:FKBP-type peptidyl-prolyl cis-trans isomerase n=1 Tax=Haloarchaeobius sp. HRN-SO-5 TaxID=3446118 RepID=UPI003EBF3B0F